MNSIYFYIQITVGILIGFLIACSPTKFLQTKQTSICSNGSADCIIQSGNVDVTQNFKIGSGKVDILFINDNSASMSKVQLEMASKFSGFLQSLDSKGIDYRIAITTTDLSSVVKNKLITFSNGQKFITNKDIDRVALFTEAIVRNETIECENLITSMFNTYGASFQSNSFYATQYPVKCPSSDTRGIYAANLIVSENSFSFIRNDANLNLILISNDNVRQGNLLENNDTATAFVNLMEQKFSNKYWDFNSIIVKDDVCKLQQTLRNSVNQVVSNQMGPAISGGIGFEYANLSNTAARDIDNNPRPRGQILDICQSDYTHNFSSMSTQIADEARMFTLKCTPMSAPTIINKDNPNSAIQYNWNGDKIVFSRDAGAANISISYRCYTGPT